MPTACCPALPPIRVTVERRRSDFERDARVTPFTGSCCCCCCCLHWIGAGIGGIVGLRLGWSAAEQQSGAPVTPETRSALQLGVAAGILLPLLLIIFAAASGWQPMVQLGEVALVAAAVAPPLVFLPIGVSMMFAASSLRRKRLAAFRRDANKLPQKDGSDASTSLYRMKLQSPPKTRDPLVQFSVFCRHCWGDLGESLHLATCPECGVAIDRPVISGPDYGMSVARRATAKALGLATLGTGAAYALMWLLAILLR